MNKQLIYRVLLKGTVVGVFNSKNTHKILLITKQPFLRINLKLK